MAIHTTNNVTEGNTSTYTLNSRRIDTNDLSYTGKGQKKVKQPDGTYKEYNILTNENLSGDNIFKVVSWYLPAPELGPTSGYSREAVAYSEPGYKFLCWLSSGNNHWELVSNFTSPVNRERIGITVYNTSGLTFKDAETYISALYVKIF